MTPARRDHAHRDRRSVHRWLRRGVRNPRIAWGVVLLVALLQGALPA